MHWLIIRCEGANFFCPVSVTCCLKKNPTSTLLSWESKSVEHLSYYLIFLHVHDHLEQLLSSTHEFSLTLDLLPEKKYFGPSHHSSKSTLHYWCWSCYLIRSRSWRRLWYISYVIARICWILLRERHHVWLDFSLFYFLLFDTLFCTSNSLATILGAVLLLIFLPLLASLTLFLSLILLIVFLCSKR